MTKPLECSACHATFSSDAAFDMHRVGKLTKEHPSYGRRCLTPSEMEKRGLERNNAGAWSRVLTDKQRAQLKALHQRTRAS